MRGPRSEKQGIRKNRQLGRDGEIGNTQPDRHRRSQETKKGRKKCYTGRQGRVEQRIGSDSQKQKHTPAHRDVHTNRAKHRYTERQRRSERNPRARAIGLFQTAGIVELKILGDGFLDLLRTPHHIVAPLRPCHSPCLQSMGLGCRCCKSFMKSNQV